MYREKNRRRTRLDRLIDESRPALAIAILVIVTIVAISVIDAVTEKRPPVENPWVGIGQLVR